MIPCIIFENPGEIDPRLITTFGVNVKDSDSAIGFFGTGLKYALSILAREGCSVEIHSGLARHEFGRQTVEIRGKPFEFVTMNGEPMGFTTEVGKNWKLWMAYRELWCNAQDEGGRSYEAQSIPDPEPGVTRVVVSGPAFFQIARDHGKYFLIGEPFLKADNCEVHHGICAGIYYRRVLVGTLAGERPMQHTYNMVCKVALSEDRVMSNSWEVGYRIAETVLQSENRQFIRECLTAPEHFHEAHMDFDYDFEPSADFMAVMDSLVRDRVATANQTAIKKYKKHATVKAAPAPVVLNAVELKMLEKARKFCGLLGFEISYPVSIVETLGESILGMASEETIYLSHRAFMMGTKTVAGTLIEEYIHLKHGLHDCTRGLQNYLLDRLVSLGELMTGEPL
jgi:hypothetical protein